MATYHPFGDLRTTRRCSSISGLVCPPYDSISPAEQRNCTGKALSYRSGSSSGLSSPETPTKTTGTAGFRPSGRMVQDRFLRQSKEPAVYIYEMNTRPGGRTGTPGLHRYGQDRGLRIAVREAP